MACRNTNSPKLDSKLVELEEIFRKSKDTARVQWAQGDRTGIPPSSLARREKVLQLIREQVNDVKEMVNGTLKRRVRNLQEKADNAAQAIK